MLCTSGTKGAAALLLGLLLWAGLAALTAQPANAQTNRDEAERQLLFARGELEAGRFDRAIKSAESALRLDPGVHRALVVKALALEALGELDRAEALLITYFELTHGLTADEEARLALERVHAAQRGEIWVPPEGVDPDKAAGPGRTGAPGTAAPIHYARVDASNVEAVSRRLSEAFPAWGWTATYEVTCPDADTEHEIKLADKGFFFRLDRGGELKIEGAEGLKRKLGKSWLCGEEAPTNQVRLTFDGDRLSGELNGEPFGPLWVRSKKAADLLTRWQLILRGDGVELRDFHVKAHAVEPSPVERFERIDRTSAKAAAEHLSARWPEARFTLRYSYRGVDKKSNHYIEWPELGFLFEINKSRELVVKGKERTIVKLEDAWKPIGEVNEVVMRFDGDMVSAVVNGVDFGPYEARDRSPNERTLPWRFVIDRKGDAMTDVVVERWAAAP